MGVRVLLSYFDSRAAFISGYIAVDSPLLDGNFSSAYRARRSGAFATDGSDHPHGVHRAVVFDECDASRTRDPCAVIEWRRLQSALAEADSS